MINVLSIWISFSGRNILKLYQKTWATAWIEFPSYNYFPKYISKYIHSASVLTRIFAWGNFQLAGVTFFKWTVAFKRGLHSSFSWNSFRGISWNREHHDEGEKKLLAVHILLTKVWRRNSLTYMKLPVTYPPICTYEKSGGMGASGGETECSLFLFHKTGPTLLRAQI